MHPLDVLLPIAYSQSTLNIGFMFLFMNWTYWYGFEIHHLMKIGVWLSIGDSYVRGILMLVKLVGHSYLV